MKIHDTCICLQNVKYISWKMTEFWCSEGRKRPFFTFPGISALSRFSSFVRIRQFQKSCGVIFRVFDDKLTLKHVSSRLSIKFQFGLSLTSSPWMTLTLNMLTKSSDWYLEAGVSTFENNCGCPTYIPGEYLLSVSTTWDPFFGDLLYYLSNETLSICLFVRTELCSSLPSKQVAA